MLEDNAYEIGDHLVASGLLAKEEFDEAMSNSEESGVSFIDILIDNFGIEKETLFTAIAEKLGVPYVNLSEYVCDPKVLEKVPKESAQKFKAIPIFTIGNRLSIAMSDPSDVNGIDQISSITGCEIEPCLSARVDIEEAILKSYKATDEMGGIVTAMSKGEQGRDVTSLSEDSPVTRLVNLVLFQAVNDRASDIHIEPDDKMLRIRFRIDGILYEIPSLPKYLQNAVISRFKILSNLDIAESRIPQDGNFKIEVTKAQVDARIATVPTIYGENVVVRILNMKTAQMQLEDLGFNEESLMRFERMISQPHGVILVTGPTGSGKTTTLYATLNRVNSVEKHIITIEDPVEYKLNLIRQISVNLKTGLNFSTGLRAILRQDPDIVMVGEVRDTETASICMQAALTGHLVFTTLHTNDAPSTLTRLQNMGIEPFLIASSVSGIIAQRLVRTICEFCKEKYVPPEPVLKRWNISGDDKDKIYKGMGCTECRKTGYSGRIGLYEVLNVDDDVRTKIMSGAAAHELRQFCIERGMRTLAMDGIEKVLSGKTTLEEISRVTEVKVLSKKDEMEMKEKISKSGTIMPTRIADVKPQIVEDYQQKLAAWFNKK
ncbi:MAG: Flp pilus assembly complex ATPase component TadA [Candidatus Aureabacteria bacterium]|nr:Flp pilus assembly complex ATPase component TadA [Candidatus Auribacterota bacterium]